MSYNGDDVMFRLLSNGGLTCIFLYIFLEVINII